MFWRKFPYISIIGEASGFKFGKQLGLVKTRHIITPKRKNGRRSGLKNLAVPLYYICNDSTLSE